KTDISRQYLLFSMNAKVKFGVSYTYKQRKYEIQGFQFVPERVSLTGNPDEIFFPENLWPLNGNGTRGTRYEPSFIPYNTNKYDASVENTGAYVSNEFSITKALKAIA